MINRIRDRKPFYKPQQKYEYTEWKAIIDNAADAKTFLKNPTGKMLQEKLKDAENRLLENVVVEERQEMTVNEFFKRVFIVPRKVVYDELVGRIKLLREVFREIQERIDLKERLEAKEARGEILIERNAR